MVWVGVGAAGAAGAAAGGAGAAASGAGAAAGGAVAGGRWQHCAEHALVGAKPVEDGWYFLSCEESI